MSDAFLQPDARQVPFEGRDRFLPALFIALLIEGALVAAFLNGAAPAAASRPAHPQIVRIKMLAPPAAKPKPLPLPPQPAPPLPQPPPPPQAEARPLPRPPHPVLAPRPHAPAVHRILHPPIHKPRPITPITPPAQPPAPPAPPAAEQANEAALYAAALRSKVQANTRVPQAVAMMHLRGVATLAIELAPSGRLVAVSILRSSGIPPIDRAALTSVQSTRFPPFPKKMPPHPMTFTLRVRLSGA